MSRAEYGRDQAADGKRQGQDLGDAPPAGCSGVSCTSTLSTTSWCRFPATAWRSSRIPTTKSIYKDYTEGDVVPGRVFFTEKGGVETAYNVGKEPFYEIVIELKE